MIINDLNYFCSAESDFLVGASGDTNVKAQFDSASLIFSQVLPSGGIFTILKTSSKINATITGEEANINNVNITTNNFLTIEPNNSFVSLEQSSAINLEKREPLVVIPF